LYIKTSGIGIQIEERIKWRDWASRNKRWRWFE